MSGLDLERETIETGNTFQRTSYQSVQGRAREREKTQACLALEGKMRRINRNDRKKEKKSLTRSTINGSSQCLQFLEDRWIFTMSAVSRKADINS
ncbi:hypothetical protein NDU88_002160 [Pleurodeles waltl]|uniref:Uncharacterized protein n=1 Tax=Pleurodeles waltl TaxID=8319 RepID=A0AAV7UWU2_PLEWA|nr:hypothetical protein NDU88_002160 [Pleurodeles waltl]